MPGTTNLGFCRGEDVTEFRGFLAQVSEFPFLLVVRIFLPRCRDTRFCL